MEFRLVKVYFYEIDRPPKGLLLNIARNDLEAGVFEALRQRPAPCPQIEYMRARLYVANGVFGDHVVQAVDGAYLKNSCVPSLPQHLAGQFDASSC